MPTFPFIPAGTKVYFEVNGNIREGVVEGINRPTMNSFSAPKSYTVRYRGGQYTTPAADVLPVD